MQRIPFWLQNTSTDVFHCYVQGFLNPTKTDRRFFQSRIRELIEQGIIERVAVLDHNPKSTTSKIPCLRLITSEEQSEIPQEHEEAVVQDPGVEEDVMDNSSGINFRMHPPYEYSLTELDRRIQDDRHSA